MSMQSRHKFTTDFKVKVVWEPSKKRSSIEQFAKKFKVILLELIAGNQP